MVIKEFHRTRADGVDLYRSYSDKGVKIQKVGTDDIYDEAIDISAAPYTYKETDIPVETIEGDENVK